METTIELPDGKQVTLSHEGELTEEAVRNAVTQLGYDLPAPKSSLARDLLGEGTRIGGAVSGAVVGSRVGGLPGAIIGGLGGAALAEAPATMIGTRDVSTGEHVANIALGAFQPAAREAALMERIGKGAVTGAALGAGHQMIQSAVDTGGIPSLGEMAPNMAVGGVLGGALEGVLGPRVGDAAKAAALKAQQEAAQAAALAKTDEGSITASLDKRKPSSLGQANAQANEIALGGKTAAPTNVPSANPVDAVAAAPAAKATTVEPSEFSLPKELANAKPRYSYGSSQFGVNFDSDLDKALYIIAQKNPSKRDADYLKLVMDHTGLSEPEARRLGAKVRDQIKQIAASDLNAESIDVPDISGGMIKPKVAPKRVSVEDMDAIDEAASAQKTEPETIKSAAIKTQDGQIFTGKLHGDAFNAAEDAGAKIGDMPDQGFITSTGRYVDRKEAMEIANNASQLKEGAKTTGGLRVEALEGNESPQGGMPITKPVVEPDLTAQALEIAQSKPIKEWRADYKAYKDAEAGMTAQTPGTDEHTAVWRDFENVRNKYGGMPVPEPPTGRAAKAPKTAVKEPVAPVATATPAVEQNAPKAAKTPTTPPPVTPPPVKETAKAPEGPEKAVRKGVKDVLASEEPSPEYKRLLSENPEIQYDVHNQGAWKDKAESATDTELRQLIDEAQKPDAKVVYLTELSNRHIAAGRNEEGQRLFVEAQKLGTPAGQTLRSLGIVKSPLTDLAEAEEVVRKAGKTLSKEQKLKVLEMSSTEIEAKKALNIAEKNAKENFSKENIATYTEAQKAHAKASREFDEYTQAIAPRSIPDMMSKIIQGNLD